jgi:glycosyltransferase involved in cell wall biosynthesis
MIKDHIAVTNEQPLISIVIVTYNASKYLQACLDSINKQSFKNIEILIIDGASKDSTVEIIKNNEARIDFWLSESDNGIYDAMNKGIRYSKGKWVLFLGADDLLLEGFNLMAEKLKNSNTLYYGYCMINNKQSNNKLGEYELAKVNVCHQAVFYPQIVFKKYRYNLHFPIYADHALNIQCWGDHSIKKKYYPYPIAKYSLEGISNKIKDPVFKREKKAWIKKYSSRWAYGRYLFRKWKESLKRNKDFS